MDKQRSLCGFMVVTLLLSLAANPALARPLDQGALRSTSTSGVPSTGVYDAPAAPTATFTRYVDAGATGANDGSSWTDAYVHLQDALDAANADDANVYEIWVAEGVYYPDEDSDGGHTDGNRAESFTLHYDNVHLYGGFDPQSGADTWAERDWATYVTVLSGDIGQDDTTDPHGVVTTTAHINGNNAYHVLWLDGVSNEPISTTTVIDGLVITAGQADDANSPHNSGGGAYCNGNGAGHACSPTLRHLLFSGNLAGMDGGGLYNNGADGGASSPTLINVVFRGNQAAFGGGLYNHGASGGASSPTLTNVTLSGNQATNNGGGMLTYCLSGGSCSPVLTNVILWGNGSEIANYDALPIVTYSLVQGGYPGTGNLDLDPQFVDAAGGNLRLQRTSPAVDAGDNSAVTLPTDLDGRLRLRDGDGDGTATVDMGAYELQMVYVDADATGANDGSSWADAYVYLQDALDQTNADGANDYDIWVAEGVYYPDEDSDGGHTDGDRTESFTLRYDNVHLYGGFDPQSGADTWAERDWATYVTVLSGDIGQDDTTDVHGVVTTTAHISGTNTYHVLWLDGVTHEDITALTVIDGLAITAGQADDATSPHRDGGGAYCNGSGAGHACSPTLRHLTLSGNLAGMDGGGLHNNGAYGGASSPTLTSVTFSGNQANFGGGLYNNGRVGGASSPTLTSVTFSGNRANVSGGGMLNFGYQGASSPVLINVILHGNQASDNGGGIYNWGSQGDSSPVLTNVTLSGNQATNNGGGLYNDGAGGNSRPVLTNVILWGNGSEIANNSAVPTVTHSLVEGGYTGTGNLNLDPRFVDAAGGDLRLRRTSPAIDAGDNSAVTVPTDVDGRLRLHDGDGDGTVTVDMGAYEFQMVYVDADATGANDGTSWADAYVDLQDALDQTNADGVSHYNIWVAEGVYYPDEDGDGDHVSGAVTETFALRYDNVHLYGGFDPQSGADTWAERDWQAYVTVLSGDIGQDDTTDAHGVVTTTAHISGTNAYHVLWLDGVSNEPISTATVIDGLAITAGQADDAASPHNRGGGLVCDGSGAGHACSPALRHLFFSGNQAGLDGGGLYNNGGNGGASSPVLTNVALHGNQAGGNGGGLYNDGAAGNSSPVLTHVTLGGNQATSGGGLYNDGAGGASHPVLTNVILWGNGSEIANNSAVPTVTYSLVEGGYAGTGNLDLDPRFVDAAGGNLRLLSASPAVDAGDNSAVTLPTDLDGNDRLRDGDHDGTVTVDMGAYELQMVYVDADATGANNGASWADAYVYLQDALDQANRCGGVADHEIWVAEGVYYPDEDSDGDHVSDAVTETFTLRYDNVRLYGGFDPQSGADTWAERDWQAYVTVLSGDIGQDDTTDAHGVVTDTAHISGTNAYRVLHLNDASLESISTATVIDGFAITAGQADARSAGGAYCNAEPTGCSPTLTNLLFSANWAYYSGAGLYVEAVEGGDSSPVLTDVTFRANYSQRADAGGMKVAGGMASFTSSPILTRVNFVGNRGFGGGAMRMDCFQADCSPILTDVTFRDNTCTNFAGGLSLVCSSNHCSLALTRVTFSGNTTAARGGGVYFVTSALHASLVLSDVTFTNNSARTVVDGGGGGLYVQRDVTNDAPDYTFDATLTDVTFSGNQAHANGGGMYYSINVNYIVGNAPVHTFPLTLTRVTFDGNQAGLNGGGLFHWVEGGMVSNPVLNDVVFTNNSAVAGGGGMYNLVEHPEWIYIYDGSASPRLTNVTFGGNQAGWGGGMYNRSIGDTWSGAHYGTSAQANPVLTNVVFTNNVATEDGGGMWNVGGGQSPTYCVANPVLVDVDFANNVATKRGGGMYNWGDGMWSEDSNTNPTLNRVTFDGNQAGEAGGGMFNEGTGGALTDVTLSTNQAVQYGGGMHNTASHLPLTHVTFSGNQADQYGGGMYNTASHPPLTYVTFSGNYAGERGGGMYNENSSNPSLIHVALNDNQSDRDGGGMYSHNSTPYLTNVTLSGNHALQDGGGIYIHSSGLDRSPVLANVLISGNRAGWYGGGIATMSENNGTTRPSLTHVTIGGNYASFGGGVHNYGTTDSTNTPQLTNVVLWGNQAQYAAPSMYNENSSPTIDYSLVQGGCPSGATCDAHLLTTDPWFVAPITATAAPTTTGDYRLLGNSPAIDAGDNLSVTVTTDLDGNPRFYDHTTPDTGNGTPPIVDMGAYETFNTVPQADAGGPYTGDEGVALPLDGSGSSDIDTGDVLLYEWDCTADGLYDTSSYTATDSTCTYPQEGAYTLRLRVTDSLSVTDVATTTVTVRNVAPLAVDDAYTTTEEVVLVVAAPGVLLNDSDVPSDTLTAILATPPVVGELALAPDGGFVYTPTIDLYGVVTFTYRAGDTISESLAATVTLTVRNVNDPPVVAGDAYTATEDVPLVIAAPGVLGNDGDVDDDPLTAAVQDHPVHGLLTLNADGAFVYTPTLDWNGVDAFTYVVSDGVLTDTAAVTLTVAAVNDAPVADAGEDRTVTGGVVTLDGSGSSDVDDDGLTYGWTQTGGEPVVLSDGSAAAPTFTTSIAHTVLTFTLVVTDEHGLASAPDEVVITVTVHRIYLPLVIRGATAAASAAVYKENAAVLPRELYR